MSAVGFKERPRLPSIYTTLQPLEGYWDKYQPYGEGASLVEFVNPLDAFLAYLALDSLPGIPMVVDLAAVSSGGVTSLLALLQPRVGQVLAASDPGSEASERVFAALEAFTGERWAKRAGLAVIPRAELPGKRPIRSPHVILIDAQWTDHQSLDSIIQEWLAAVPGAMFVVFNLGRAGECPAVEALISLCSVSGPNRLWLLREAGEVLAASRMAIVARRDHSHAADVVVRLQQQFTGNHHVLDLLNADNLARVRATNVDVELIKAFPDWPISRELDEHKRSAQAAHEEAAALRHRVNELQQQFVVRTVQRGFRRILLPSGTRRHRLAEIIGREWGLWKSNGARAMLRRRFERIRKNLRALVPGR